MRQVPITDLNGVLAMPWNVARNITLFLCFIFMGAQVIAWLYPDYVYHLSDRERTGAGTVQEISTRESFWGDTTTLRMTGEKVVVLDGRINPWQPGERVTQPAKLPNDTAETAKKISRMWCVQDQCLQQK